MHTLFVLTTADREDPDEMPHNVTFHQGLHCLLRQKLQFCLEIKTCGPLNYTMDHSKFIASIQKEEFISSFKSSANYYLQQQSLNHMYMMKHQILWISCCCHSLNCIYNKSCKFHAESTPVMEKFLWSLFLVTNIEWEKPAAHVICSFMDSSG